MIEIVKGAIKSLANYPVIKLTHRDNKEENSGLIIFLEKALILCGICFCNLNELINITFTMIGP